MLKHLWITLIALLLLSCNTNESITTNTEGIFSKKDLIQDFDNMVKGIEASSPKAFTDTIKLKKVIQLQRSKISDMTKYEFTQILAPVISALDCGHSSIEFIDTDLQV